MTFGFPPKIQSGERMRPSAIVAVNCNDAKRHTRAQTDEKREQEDYESDHGDLTPNGIWYTLG
jgi:hypothetical protein